MRVTGTRSVKKSAGRRVGGRTGGTFSGNDSAAAAAIRLDFPVPRSPATTTRTLVRPPELLECPTEPPANAIGFDCKERERERACQRFCNCFRNGAQVCVERKPGGFGACRNSLHLRA
jgi:hypothetical protein